MEIEFIFYALHLLLYEHHCMTLYFLQCHYTSLLHLNWILSLLCGINLRYLWTTKYQHLFQMVWFRAPCMDLVPLMCSPTQMQYALTAAYSPFSLKRTLQIGLFLRHCCPIVTLNLQEWTRRKHCFSNGITLHVHVQGIQNYVIGNSSGYFMTMCSPKKIKLIRVWKNALSDRCSMSCR